MDLTQSGVKAYASSTQAVDPNPPRTEAPHLLQQELEQRHAEALSKREYHASEAASWLAVAQACEQALKSLASPQVDQPERF
jgi:hypothetical protein